jgi:arylsulfatase A-like enzyme
MNTFVSTTHPPFGSEWPYYTLFSDPAYAGESKFVMARLTDPWDIIRRQRDTKKDFDIDQIIDLYDGSVRNFDEEVKRIVDHLRECGLADNTIVVIYSDHGMEFFEHDTWGQGNSVRGDASAKIPLLIVDPRRPGAGACPSIVRSIDLAPTLLDLVGLPVSDRMDGVSLKPYLEGAGIGPELSALNETGIWVTDVPGLPANHLRYPDLLELLEVPDKRTGTLAIKREFQDVVVRAKDRMIRHGRWKLTYQPLRDGPRYALYDLERDPDCLRDVAAEHPEVLADLEARLRRWLGSERSVRRFAPTRSGVLQAY